MTKKGKVKYYLFSNQLKEKIEYDEQGRKKNLLHIVNKGIKLHFVITNIMKIQIK